MAIHLTETGSTFAHTGVTKFGANLLQDMFHAKVFVKTLRRNLIALPLATFEDAPRSSGKSVRWQFLSNPTAATTPLTEGSTPGSSEDLTTTPIHGVLQEYGDFFDVSALLLKTAASGTKEAIVEAAGYQAALTLDTLVYNDALGDTTNTNDAGTALTAEDIRVAVQELKQNDAKPHPMTPGGSFYAGLFSVEAAYDMMGEGAPVWFQAKSSDFESALTTPFVDTVPTAALYGCIIKTSTNIQRDAGASPDDDLNYIVADNSFGAVSIDSNLMDPSVIITNPEQRVDLPLRNAGTIGWIVWFDTEAFDSNRIVEILSDATGIGV